MILKLFNLLQEILRTLTEINTVLRELKPAHAIEPDELLDNSDAKQLLKVADSTLYRWRKQNLIAFKFIGKKHYYLKSDLRKMMGAS